MTQQEDSTAVILAAGKGTRMKSDLPKVLFPLRGRPLLDYVLDAAGRAGIGRCLVVVGYKGEDVEAAVAGRGVKIVWQREQLGTGHAVQMAAPQLQDCPGDVVVLMGDVPLIRPDTLRALLEAHRRAAGAVTVLTADLEDPTGYGRIVRDGEGRVAAIVEHKDCTPEQLAIGEINSGIFAFQRDFLLEALPRLNNDNEQAEYYLTDTVAMACARGLRVDGVKVADFQEVAGINNKEQLAEADRRLEERSGGA